MLLLFWLKMVLNVISLRNPGELNSRDFFFKYPFREKLLKMKNFFQFNFFLRPCFSCLFHYSPLPFITFNIQMGGIITWWNFSRTSGWQEPVSVELIIQGGLINGKNFILASCKTFLPLVSIFSITQRYLINQMINVGTFKFAVLSTLLIPFMTASFLFLSSSLSTFFCARFGFRTCHFFNFLCLSFFNSGSLEKVNRPEERLHDDWKFVSLSNINMILEYGLREKTPQERERNCASREKEEMCNVSVPYPEMFLVELFPLKEISCS